MKKIFKIPFLLIYELTILPISGIQGAFGQTAMINAPARHTKSLNGKWQVIVDPIESGNWKLSVETGNIKSLKALCLHKKSFRDYISVAQCEINISL